jgi:hypothetical protein
MGKEVADHESLDWILALFATWLIAAPFLLGYAGTKMRNIVMSVLAR